MRACVRVRELTACAVGGTHTTNDVLSVGRGCVRDPSATDKARGDDTCW